MIAVEKNIPGIWKILEQLTDPEIPVLSIVDLGIVRKIDFIEFEQNYLIQITPTYSGCPAIDAIKMNIQLALHENKILNYRIEQVLSPAWTTDWITENGKQQLLAYGIAPPKSKKTVDSYDNNICCPQCNSLNTVLIAQFGSTACKALYKCNDCLEPFDYFKCH
ncbi:MAG: 1,2-phenylacetyl-CoA epoxidase subunit PaaD [Chitinophagaceae bacterium]